MPKNSTPGRPEQGAGENELHRVVAMLHARVNELEGALDARDARIAELEKQLGEARRSGKRQAAPFSKGAPDDEPARPGRKSGSDHGRHGHRMQPAAKPDRELDAPCRRAVRTAAAGSTTSGTRSSSSSTCPRSARA